MKSRKSYPTIIKWAYAKGRENEIVPPKQRRLIPKQTIWQWKNLNLNAIDKLEEDLHLRQEISSINSKHGINFKFHQQFLIAATKIQLKTIEIIGEQKYHNILASDKVAFVRLIEHYSELIDRGTLLKWFRISTKRFLAWQSQVNYDCSSSVISLCAKRYSNQTTMEEFQIIEKSLTDKNYLHWPKCSIHSMLLKQKKLIISRSTFYKYADQIKPTFKRPKGYRKKRAKLRANQINELWHFDISYFRTLDGQKHYIYAIIDNYSRKILEWEVRSLIRNKYVSEMLLRALGVQKPKLLKIMSDGGKENVGKHVKIMLQKYKIEYGSEVKHMIALKDIDYSNNMIERFFRIMKSDYLYLTDIENGDILFDKISHLMKEYNYVRPHYAHQLLTPHEVYIGIKLPDMKARHIAARIERINTNRTCSCTLCTCDT
ncbi:MAG: hypothetical protein DRI84_05110 [Bacteroidetes bacterium]|nr:MAG: hypothetical protein DRI84_05110 [Bacteroidota bacterium]